MNWRQGRTVLSDDLRFCSLASLGCVDHVVVLTLEAAALEAICRQHALANQERRQAGQLRKAQVALNALDKDFDSAARMADQRPGQDTAYVIDYTLARQELDWMPQVSLKKGLTEIID